MNGEHTAPVPKRHVHPFVRMNGVEVDRETWKKGHQLFLQAFQEPAAAPEKKKLARLLKKPLEKEIADALFPYPSFLLGLGRMNLSRSCHSRSMSVPSSYVV